MKTIRATCGDCGDIELGADEVRVRVCADDESSSYLFRCPACHMPVVKPAQRRIVELLVAAGVTLSIWSRPAELAEPRSTSGPITDDELLDFHQCLHHDETWVEALRTLVPSP
ncbi:MAG: hypothetical protein H0V33_12100 [Acidimicrobiia bacterium]|jgi:hypothetical protein|nr:hypothetical protein [Acidimicrobiia bacterium]